MIFQLGELPCYAGVGSEEVSSGESEMLGVYMLWTDPEYRKMGLGRQMVNLLRRRFPRLAAMPVSEDGIEFAKHLSK
jgi:ribosomal protein S18 acetylase RimI-like enzyme